MRHKNYLAIYINRITTGRQMIIFMANYQDSYWEQIK